MHLERERQDRERAGLARQRDVAGRQHVPALVVPQADRDRTRVGEPAQLLLAGQRLAAERLQRAPEHRHARGRAIGVDERLAGHQQLDGARRRRRGLERPAPFGDPLATAGGERRPERLRVGLARERRVEPLESPGRLQQQRRRVAAAALRERQPRLQTLHPRALEVVELPELGDRQQLLRGVAGSGLVLGLRGRERSLGALLRVGGQGRRSARGRRRPRPGRRAPVPAPPSARARPPHPRRGRRPPRRGARRGGRDRGPDRSRRRAHGAPPGAPRASLLGRPPSARADGRTRRACRSRTGRRPRPAPPPPRRSPAARTRARAAQRRRPARRRPRGRAGACPRAASRTAGGSSPRSGPRAAQPGARTRRQARPP